MINKLRSLISCILAAGITVSACAAVCLAEDADDAEEPLRIICTSDILMRADAAELAADRLRLYNFCTKLAAEGKVDAMLIGGDITAGKMTENVWKYLTKQLSQVLAEASDTVLYMTGNMDYFAGEDEGFNSGDYISTVMADRLGELYYWDVYYETIDGVEYPLAYRYLVGDVYFYFLNTSPADMAGALRYGNFVYSQNAVTWVENKLKVDDPDGDATIFLSAHFPLEGDGSLSQTMEESLSQRITNICAQHVNLIYLHSSDMPAVTSTEEKVDRYNTEGLVLTENEEEGITLSSLWTFVPYEGGLYAVVNCDSGEYLTVEDGMKLRMSKEAALWEVRTVNGRIMLLAADGVQGVRVPKNQTSEFVLGKATALELYARSADSEGTVYTYSADIEPGRDYVIVSDSKYVMTSSPTEDGLSAIEARVMGDELIDAEKKTSVDGDESFTSVFMGTASGAGDGLQYLDIEVYEDRVEVSLVNYNADKGTFEVLSPYVRDNLTKPDTSGNSGGSSGTSQAKDGFNTGMYVAVAAASVAVGGIIGGVAVLWTRKRKFFG